MTREDFKIMMSGVCARLSELQEVYWTVTDLSAIYTTTPDYWPGWVDVAFLEWVVKRRIVTTITLAPGAGEGKNELDENGYIRVYKGKVDGWRKPYYPGAVLDVAKDGKECVLFCRHYLLHWHECLLERYRREDAKADEEVIIPALTNLWRTKITRLGKEKAIKEMRASFPGVYGVGYKDQLNKAFKIATDGK